MNKKRLMRVLRYRLFIVGLLLLQLLFLVYLILSWNYASRWISTILSTLSILATIHVISKKQKPGYKLTWVFFIMALPVFGGIFYLVTQLQPSVHRFSRNIIRTQQDVVRRLPVKTGALESAIEAHADCEQLAKYLQKCVGFPLYPGGRTEYFPSGEAYFESLLTELPKAKRYIFIESFIIEEGLMWDSVLEILKEKAKSGVEVRLLFDDFGCFLKLPHKYSDEIRKYGIQCEVFNPFKPALSVLLNNRDHRKIVSIDGEIAYTGGINFADEYINHVNRFGRWRDAAILTEGESAWSLTLMFLQMWSLSTGKQPEFDRLMPKYENKPLSTEAFVHPYADNPLDEENVAEHVYMHIITAARQYIYISTPYLIVDDSMVSALTLAAKSGVDVRIMTPENWDKRLVHVTTRTYYRDLIEGGVKIYEYSGGFNHAKTFVSDDLVASVGTANLDYRSLYTHFECGLCLYGGEAILDVRDDFLQTLETCRKVSLADCEMGWLKRVALEMLRVFAPLM